MLYYMDTYILVILNKLSSGVPPSFSRGSFFYYKFVDNSFLEFILILNTA